MNTTELQLLIDDFGGGREKSNELSQKFYNAYHKATDILDGMPYDKIELFLDYMRILVKKSSTFSQYPTTYVTPKNATNQSF